jgi:hypothetical protein
MTVMFTPSVLIYQMVTNANVMRLRVIMETVKSAMVQLMNASTVLTHVTRTPPVPTPTQDLHAHAHKVGLETDTTVGHHFHVHGPMTIMTTTLVILIMDFVH